MDDTKNRIEYYELLVEILQDSPADPENQQKLELAKKNIAFLRGRLLTGSASSQSASIPPPINRDTQPRAPAVPPPPAALPVAPPPVPQKISPPSTSAWDRLPATGLGDENPPLVPYPRYVLNSATGIVERIPAPRDTITLKDIAGAEDVKTKLEDTLINTFLYPNVFVPESAQDGFLLYGVPGTGKTLIAQATVLSIEDRSGALLYRTPDEVARLDRDTAIGDDPAKGIVGFRKTFYPDEKQVPQVLLVKVSISDITSRLVGESTRRLQRIFELARRIQPAILFFDEADAYLNPDDKNNNATVATFKDNQGGFGTKGDRVIVFIATNYPLRIETAIRARTAGGDVEVGLPGRTARCQIFHTSLVRELHGFVIDKEQLHDVCLTFALLTAPKPWKVIYSGNANDLVEDTGYQMNPVEQKQFDEIAARIDKIDDVALRRKVNERFKSSSFYSGRDLTKMLKNALDSTKRRSISGRVIKCNSEAIKTLGYCKSYGDYYKSRNSDPAPYLWVPVIDQGDIDALIKKKLAYPNDEEIKKVSELPPSELRYIVPDQVRLVDVFKGFADFTPTASISDLMEQMKFNQVRGFVAEKTDLVSKYYIQRIKEDLLEDTRGQNNSVPLD